MIKSKYRDMTIVEFENDNKIFISCDSCSAIGLKKEDVIKVAPEITGYHTANTISCELEALGVSPKIIVNNVCAEMDNTGIGIIKGIKTYLNKHYLGENIKITGSTEENFETLQTSVGMVAIGYKKIKNYKIFETKKEMELLVAGRPKVGNEVKDDKGEIINASTIRKLRKIPGVVDILPVGSKGIEYEANNIKKCLGLDLKLFYDIKVDIYKSSGPSTSCIITIDTEKTNIDEIKKVINKPIEKIGKYY